MIAGTTVTRPWPIEDGIRQYPWTDTRPGSAHCRALADKYAGARCTLNGQPASIGGRRNDFANVGTVNGPLSVEYAWPTVAHVMEECGGRFRA